MNKKGFTLVELVATIVILGIILMVAVPSYIEFIEKSKESKCKSDERAILDAAEAFVDDCIFKNECSTGKYLVDYINSDELKVSDLISNGFVNSDYEKYNNIKIKITATPNSGANNYSFEIKEKATQFDNKCK